MALKINSNQSVNLPSIEDILKEQAKTFAEECERNSKHFGESTEPVGTIENILQAQADDFAEYCNSNNFGKPIEPVGNMEDSPKSAIEQVTSDNLSQLLCSSMFRELNSCSFNQLRQRIIILTFENMTLKNEIERLTEELTNKHVDC